MSDLPAGRELDALVAEEVMGYERDEALAMSQYPSKDPAALPRFSTDIAAAWQVADRVGISVLKIPTGWAAGVWPEGEDNRGEYRSGECYDGDFKHYAEADTAPLAICYAALTAVGAR